MSLFELFIVLLISAALALSSCLQFEQMVRAARLSSAAAELAAEIRYQALAALEQRRDIVFRFNQAGYEITAEAAGLRARRKMPLGIAIREARFGAGGAAVPVLRLSSTGISSPGRVVLSSVVLSSSGGASSAGKMESCVITRTLRGITKTSCN